MRNTRLIDSVIVVLMLLGFQDIYFGILFSKALAEGHDFGCMSNGMHE
jgi:hypothetical protein